MRVPAAVLALVATLAACGPSPGDPVVDGLRVGGVANCGACEQPTQGSNCGACASVADVAREAFDLRWPGHAAIASLTFHEEGCPPSGNAIAHCLIKRSGHLVVAVADFADWTQHAVPVYCGIGGCRFASEYSPSR